MRADIGTVGVPGLESSAENLQMRQEHTTTGEKSVRSVKAVGSNQVGDEEGSEKELSLYGFSIAHLPREVTLPCRCHPFLNW